MYTQYAQEVSDTCAQLGVFLDKPHELHLGKAWTAFDLSSAHSKLLSGQGERMS